MSENIQLKPDFKQVCVWPGCILGKSTVVEFEEFFKNDFNTRIQFLEEIKTLPDTENGRPVPDTGGRNDIFFAIHDEDISNFSIPRFQIGVRWIEDVLASCNYRSRIYPERVFDYCSWNEEALAKEC